MESAEPDPMVGRMLPVLYGESPEFCLLGTTAGEAALAVAPFTAVDRLQGTRRSLVGGICDPERRTVELLEFCLHTERPASGPELDEARVLAEEEVIPTLDVHAEPRSVVAACRRIGELPVLLYCRKRHVLFAGRCGSGEEPAEFSSADEAVAAQRDFLRKLDPIAEPRAAARHPCVACPEQGRCFPTDGGFVYATERLTLVNARRRGTCVQPLGEWRLSEAAAWLGGAAPETLRDPALGVLDDWRRQRLAGLSRMRPRLLLPPDDPRTLAERVRLKLGLLSEALRQLEAAWARGGRPHLNWNADTVRVAARPAGQTPAVAWGLAALLRKTGWQGAWNPEATGRAFEAGAADDARVYRRVRPWAPVFTDADLLPEDVRAAGLFFGRPRTTQVYIKAFEPRASGAGVTLLLEDHGWSRRLFTPADLLELIGDGWRAWVAPLGHHDPDDGAGLAVSGAAEGGLAPLVPGAMLAAVKVSWWAYFGEAVDLVVLGRLMLETLLANDARTAVDWRAGLRRELEDLEACCAAVELERRPAVGREWLAQRCADDSPASIWSRRNVLYRAADRAATRLDGLPVGLWQATVGLAVRMGTLTPGFSFCGDRSQAVPRWGSLSLPQEELRGLLAAYDDLLFGRKPGSGLLR